MRLHNRKTRGFALIEVLVAVVVLAMGVIFVFRSFSTSAGALRVSRNYSEATSVLAEAIGGLRDGTLPLAADTDSVVTIEGREYVLSHERVAGSRAAGRGLREVLIKVRWENDRREVVVSTLVEE